MTEGRKDDDGKPRWSLIPGGVLREVVAVLEHGAARYGAESWRAVPNGRVRYYDALMRHVDAWRSGEGVDRESGLPHLAHVAVNALFLLALDGVGK